MGVCLVFKATVVGLNTSDGNMDVLECRQTKQIYGIFTAEDGEISLLGLENIFTNSPSLVPTLFYNLIVIQKVFYCNKRQP